MNNERIRELALQAGLSRMPSNCPDMADLYKGADFELEKFVELIIKECTDVLHDNELLNRHISHALNEHFGVD